MSYKPAETGFQPTTWMTSRAIIVQCVLFFIPDRFALPWTRLVLVVIGITASRIGYKQGASEASPLQCL